MPLSLDDEIFVEKCFQRSLLVRHYLSLLRPRNDLAQELDKLMSYSGTPTVVWRRTGEICLVAPEFCMLTEWPLEDLVGSGRKKYIYEVRVDRAISAAAAATSCANYAPAAVRKPICCGILGKLRFTRF